MCILYLKLNVKNKFQMKLRKKSQKFREIIKIMIEKIKNKFNNPFQQVQIVNNQLYNY